MAPRSFLLFLILALPALAQNPPPDVTLANLQENVQGLTERVNELSLRIEDLEHANGEQRDRIAQLQKNCATVQQLNDAVADLNRSLQAALASLQQAPASSASLTETDAGSTPAQTSAPAAADYPKEGISYTVQRGETLALIAKKTGAKLRDIINANKIADPSRIQAGQTLFIPGGK